MKSIHSITFFLVFLITVPCLGTFKKVDEHHNTARTSLKITFGLVDPERSKTVVTAMTGSAGIEINVLAGGKPGEITANVSWPQPTDALRKLAQHKDSYTVSTDGIWGYLLDHGAPGQVRRLKDDQWNVPDAAILTVYLKEDSTAGFSIALQQLIKHGAMWLPEHDAYITLADRPVAFKEHHAGLQGKRVLDRVAESPEASLEAFKGSWVDFGNPNKWNASWQTKYMGTEGHLTVTAAAHGSIYKFAIDRWANVRPDFASPQKFRLDIQWPQSSWERQRIEDGLPLIITDLKKGNQQCQIEQFAVLLTPPPANGDGRVESVLLSKLKFSEGPQEFMVTLNSESMNTKLALMKIRKSWAVVDKQTNNIWLLFESAMPLHPKLVKVSKAGKGEQVALTLSANIKKGTAGEIILKLPAPVLKANRLRELVELKYAAAKEETIAYWQNWLDGGAFFEVPEPEVNALFRASLWHSLILPRHKVEADTELIMDLPYANTAYGQEKADWPVNQAVYVDYMIYGMRGYDAVAANELASMFKTQQQADGRIGGFANWTVYSPAQLYTIAQNYLLSGNQASFERLLPDAIKTLDYCMNQIRKAKTNATGTGLVLGPLNDLTHAEREWAFTQAYFVAGLELFGKSLQKHQHPRASETITIAAQLKQDVVNTFSKSSVQSPVVQLEDGTWINYVPTDAMTPRRMMEQWYPTDVDCGPLHLSRLGVLEPHSWLTTAMLHDHEDNLFLGNLGAANEPVYVQQGNTYLHRDEPKSAIRSFYSLMACGFSHDQLTSLEHRWAWGQYFGPPCTDGAWFELYRRMLLNEIGMDTLMIGQAIPRKWLQGDKGITVKNAPTYFGPLSFTIQPKVAKNEIQTLLNLSGSTMPKTLIVRLRHPEEKPLRSVTVNGKTWDFDQQKEQLVINAPAETSYEISATY
ncbi:hypothetical protein [Pedobacter sp.]|uniref:hypothetical protein n=1 Tax=Pedobacter sp. TaxID=1411316 RepID=UPI003D7F7108